MAISSVIVTLTIAGVVVSLKRKCAPDFAVVWECCNLFLGSLILKSIKLTRQVDREVSDTSKADSCTSGWTRITTPGDLPRVVCHIAILCFRGEVILSE